MGKSNLSRSNLLTSFLAVIACVFLVAANGFDDLYFNGTIIEAVNSSTQVHMPDHLRVGASTVGSGNVDFEVVGNGALTGYLVVGDDSAPTSSNVLFELSSTAKGLLLPRLTTAQRDALTMSGNDSGLVIYNSSQTKPQFYDGTQWGDSGSVPRWAIYRHQGDCVWQTPVNTGLYTNFAADSTCTFSSLISKNFGTVTSSSTAGLFPQVEITGQEDGTIEICTEYHIRNNVENLDCDFRLYCSAGTACSGISEQLKNIWSSRFHTNHAASGDHGPMTMRSCGWLEMGNASTATLTMQGADGAGTVECFVDDDGAGTASSSAVGASTIRWFLRYMR